MDLSETSRRTIRVERISVSMLLGHCLNSIHFVQFPSWVSHLYPLVPQARPGKRDGLLGPNRDL